MSPFAWWIFGVGFVLISVALAELVHYHLTRTPAADDWLDRPDVLASPERRRDRGQM